MYSPQEAATYFLARLIEPTRILVAVSGGSDSIGLLLSLHQALAAGGGASHTLVSATVDHGLRPEAADEAKVVALLCQNLGIPHAIHRWDGAKPKSGISAAARDARYQLLMQAADAAGADVIVTGHTIDDQVETIAMRAARSGADVNLGLAGMAEAVLLERRRWLLRPFLSVRREAIRDFLREQGRGWLDDPSNADVHYERVRVRAGLEDEHAMVPQDIQSAGSRRMQLAQDAAELAHRHLRIERNVLARLAPEALNENGETLRHLLATLAAIFGGRPHLPASTTMTRVMAMLDGQRMGRTTAGRVIFDLRRQGLFLHREARDLPIIHVGSGTQAVWDGRYRIVNETSEDVTVVATPPDREIALELFPDIPPAIAMRAMGVMPHVGVGPALSGDKASVIVRPILAPFDRFLPQFDVILARKLGLLFGYDELPAAPIKVLEQKS